MSGPCRRPECGGVVHTDPWGTSVQCPHAEPSEFAAAVGCGVLHLDPQGNVIPCPDRAPVSEGPRCAEIADCDGKCCKRADEGHPEPPTEEELNPALPVRPDPRQPAYDAVYEYIRGLGGYLPPDTVHRNGVIWRAVHAALNATPVGRCVSSHCVEDDHILPVEGETR